MPRTYSIIKDGRRELSDCFIVKVFPGTYTVAFETGGATKVRVGNVTAFAPTEVTVKVHAAAGNRYKVFWAGMNSIGVSGGERIDE
jgi:hypothetical protein